MNYFLFGLVVTVATGSSVAIVADDEVPFLVKVLANGLLFFLVCLYGVILGHHC